MNPLHGFAKEQYYLRQRNRGYKSYDNPSKELSRYMIKGMKVRNKQVIDGNILRSSIKAYYMNGGSYDPKTVSDIAYKTAIRYNQAVKLNLGSSISDLGKNIRKKIDSILNDPDNPKKRHTAGSLIYVGGALVAAGLLFSPLSPVMAGIIGGLSSIGTSGVGLHLMYTSESRRINDVLDKIEKGDYPDEIKESDLVNNLKEMSEILSKKTTGINPKAVIRFRILAMKVRGQLKELEKESILTEGMVKELKKNMYL